MTRQEKAMDYFTQGYCCSQAVVLAFDDLLDIDRKTLLQLSSSFGGGMGRLREVCGAVSGMFMVAGLLYGFDESHPGQKKAAHYARIQALAARFREQCGSIVCRELLGAQCEAPAPLERTPEYYRKRPCKELVGLAAALMDELIAQEPPQTR